MKWKFKLPGDDTPSKRGVSYWPGDGKLPASIIFGTDNGILYSLKASDGTLNAGFGENGIVRRLSNGREQQVVLFNGRSFATIIRRARGFFRN